MIQNRTEHEGVLVTVVTPSFNQGRFIRDTIESVLSQDYPNLEYLVIDGGSTDETQEVLKAYGSRLCWVAEKDEGQADAVNKGFRRAKGDILGWLNSDDTYCPGAIRKVVEFFKANPDISMVYGEGHKVDAKGNIIERHPTEAFSYQRLAETCFISQPTVFFRRHVFEEVGPLDINLHYCLDYEYWMRVGKRFKLGYMPESLATTRFHGAAKTVAKRKEADKEVVAIVQRHYATVPLRTVYVHSYANMIERVMPHVQGLYPNGWTAPYITIFLPNVDKRFCCVLIEGYLAKNIQALTLHLTHGSKTVERQISAPGPFTLREELSADDEGELTIRIVSPGREQRAQADGHSFSRENRPFSYRLPGGRQCVIRKVTVIDHAGRKRVLFSRTVALRFMVALPIEIIRNSFVINGRLSLGRHCKALWNLWACVFRAKKTP